MWRCCINADVLYTCVQRNYSQQQLHLLLMICHEFNAKWTWFADTYVYRTRIIYASHPDISSLLLYSRLKKERQEKRNGKNSQMKKKERKKTNVWNRYAILACHLHHFFFFSVEKNETKKFDESHNIDNIYEYIVFNLLMNKYNHYKIE